MHLQTSGLDVHLIRNVGRYVKQLGETKRLLIKWLACSACKLFILPCVETNLYVHRYNKQRGRQCGGMVILTLYDITYFVLEKIAIPLYNMALTQIQNSIQTFKERSSF